MEMHTLSYIVKTFYLMYDLTIRSNDSYELERLIGFLKLRITFTFIRNFYQWTQPDSIESENCVTRPNPMRVVARNFCLGIQIQWYKDTFSPQLKHRITAIRGMPLRQNFLIELVKNLAGDTCPRIWTTEPATPPNPTRAAVLITLR